MRHSKLTARTDEPDVLTGALAELDELETRMQKTPALEINGVPGRKPSSCRMAVGDDGGDDGGELQRLIGYTERRRFVDLLASLGPARRERARRRRALSADRDEQSTEGEIR